jgi:general secretion pathway protein E
MAPTPDELHELRQRAEDFGLAWLIEVGDELLDPDLLKGLPVEWARTHALLPIRWRGEVCLLVSDPADLGRLDDVALLIGTDLRPVLAPRAIIAESIERCYVSRRDTADDFLRGMEAAPSVRPAESRSDDLLKMSEEAPVSQLVNLILLEAVKGRASDIHIEPFEDRLRVRFRVDGILYEQSAPPRHLEPALVSRIKVMARVDIAEKRLPQDGMARVRVGEREIDIRVSTIPVAEGERVVLRLLNRDSSLLPLTDLGMPERMLAGFQGVLHEAHGLILVCGPTGSGKTTTLYAAIRQLDTRGRNVLTIEDPVEYQLPDIGQMQVKPKIGLTFARGLRHILRQDPDVILVGETRDNETAEIAVRASLTGHLVLTTLHTNDAPSAVIRMMDMGVESYLLAGALRAALAQRLVRRLCPQCRTPVTASAAMTAPFGSGADRLIGKTVYGSAQCPACLEGYRGRVGIFELLLVDEAMQGLIRDGVSSPQAMRAADSGRQPTLLDDALDKVLAGATSLAEVAFALGGTGATAR